MTQEIFKEIKEELNEAISGQKHPFRFCTLGTVGLENIARLRTVVLRNVDTNLQLTFYTDTRSKKIVHIKENKKVSLLFYHPEKLIQIRIEGLATIVKDRMILEKNWKDVGSANRKDYKTKTAPGSGISDPSQIEYLEDSHYFCMVAVEPFKIEYLKLQQPHHLRVRFSKENAAWDSEFLVP
ncbi:pyridoxamine 5'-phosphate oxidase family protein [Kriegella aquimaris]|uniref:General stress protein 26 n=1 Tax=Kriegella aquimaris TaxID=192904 RepID=A0A1G9WE79_9FLAO|nr:pyridoxamine 5'-phosphate oxidase family protein [Kriegella aquimaris]SDM82842.1 General stress protein 26 [Kriegella aquimaris]